MSDAKDDGGAAFPVLPPCDAGGNVASGYPYPEVGMSLRDWFAGQAVIGVTSDLGGDSFPDAIANQAYAIADAMIARRKIDPAP